MAEEDTKKAADAAPEAAAPAPATENGKGNSGKKKNDRKDQVPIEELFDLSKPIPRVSYHLFILLVGCDQNRVPMHA